MSLIEHVMEITRRDPASIDWHPGDRIRAKRPGQKKTGTVLMAVQYAIYIHPDGMPDNCQEVIYLKDGWRLEHLTEPS